MEDIVQPKPVIRFEISRSLNGNKIFYIARDPYGVVRLRSENREALEKMIFEYRLPEPQKPLVDKEAVIAAKIDTLVEAVVEAQAEAADEEVSKKVVKKSAPTETPEQTAALEEKAVSEKKEFLRNELKETIEDKKDSNQKKSFWDRLK
jgi:hypothetical protein